MNTYLYVKVLFIVMFILYVMYQYPHIFYPQELAEGFVTSKNSNKKDYKLEKSIEFSSKNEFNNNNFFYLYSDNLNEKEIFKKHNIDSEFVEFYNDRKENRNKKFYKLNIENPPEIKGDLNVDEIMVGYDKKDNNKKLFYTADNNIYCILKKNNKIFYRYYALDDYYHKKKLIKLIGKERTDLFYKLFNIKKNGKGLLEDQSNPVLEIFETDSLNKSKEDPIAYNFLVKPLNFKLGFQKDKITKFLKDLNYNTDGFKEWCSQKENKNKYIYRVMIMRKSAKPSITFYYRD